MEQSNIINAKIGKFRLKFYHVYAMQYLSCHRSFHIDAQYSPIPYALLCRAIELELKAKHIPAKSREELANKPYGHNLKNLYDDLPDSEKILDAAEVVVLEHASRIYAPPNKGFDYVSLEDALGKHQNFPDISVLEQIATKLIDAPQQVE